MPWLDYGPEVAAASLAAQLFYQGIGVAKIELTSRTNAGGSHASPCTAGLPVFDSTTEAEYAHLFDIPEAPTKHFPPLPSHVPMYRYSAGSAIKCRNSLIINPVNMDSVAICKVVREPTI